MKSRDAMPDYVLFLLMASKYKMPVGSAAIERARQQGPEYFNWAGEFDPYFERRNILLNLWLIAKIKWWRLYYWVRDYYWKHLKRKRCAICGRRLRGVDIWGLIHHEQNCRDTDKIIS